MESVTTPAAGTAKDAIYTTLRRRIIEFDLLPGQDLSENLLATELGVSRSPVRDALARLEDEGCVVVYPQRGTKVAHISTERVQQAVFLYTTLEQSVLETLCTNGVTPQQMEALENSLRLQRRYFDEGNDAGLLEEDTRMHRLLYEFCGHEAAWVVFQATNCDLQRVRYLKIRTFSYKVSMSAVESWENSLTEHRMMLDALRRRDAEAVCLLNNHHIGSILWSGENLRRIYPQYFEADEI